MTDDDENPDDFDGIIADQQQQDDGEPPRVGMVRGVRAKDSAEIEERERVYLERLVSTDLNNADLPIPFFNEAGECEPPTPADAKDLMDKFGITVEEYMELVS